MTYITIITTRNIDEETKQYDSGLSAFEETQQLYYSVIEIIPLNNQTRTCGNAAAEKRVRTGTVGVYDTTTHPSRTAGPEYTLLNGVGSMLG